MLDGETWRSMTSTRQGLPWLFMIVKFDVGKCGKRPALRRDKGVDWSSCSSRSGGGGFSDEFETSAIQGLEIREVSTGSLRLDVRMFPYCQKRNSLQIGSRGHPRASSDGLTGGITRPFVGHGAITSQALGSYVQAIDAIGISTIQHRCPRITRDPALPRRDLWQSR